MDSKISIKVINKSNNALPEYATLGAAGADIHAFLQDDIILFPLERRLVSTGLFFEIPFGFEAQIRPRSGLAIKNGITCLNTPGTIDSDYRGEVKVILINLSKEDFIIKNGDRIAQIVFNKIEQVNFKLAIKIEESERGEGGFGSTGK